MLFTTKNTKYTKPYRLKNFVISVSFVFDQGVGVGVAVAGKAITTSTVLGRMDSTNTLSTNGLTFGSS
jgi:hypothetical protein